MSLLRELVPDDQTLVRYLLGLLPDEEAERLDELSIVDDEVAARLRSVENDLVDAYVSGTLDGEILARFESHYLASPLRREKVQFAKRLLGTVDRAPASGVGGPRTTPSRADESLHFGAELDALERVPVRSRRAWLPGAAAVLLLTCGVVFVEEVRLQRGLTDAERESAATDQRARALSGQLDEQRAANDAMARELDRLRAAQPAPAQPAEPIALVLLPQTRAVGPVSAIAVPHGTSAVPFELQLEAGDFTRYQVALKDPATNHIVWRSHDLTPDPSRHPPAISISVPASLLAPRHYLFELSGRRSAGEPEIIGSYAFQIESR